MRQWGNGAGSFSIAPLPHCPITRVVSVSMRLRLAWIVAAMLVFSGTFAAPTRATESTRLVTTCAWYAGDEARPETVRQTRRAPRPGRALVVFHTPSQSPARPVRLAHQLFQRPPPTRT